MLKSSGLGEGVSKAVGRLFVWVPVHPDIITLSSVIFAVGGFAAFGYDARFSFVLFLIAVFLDVIDGAVARVKNLPTARGAFLDGISDRVVEFFLLLSFFSVTFPVLLLEAKWWLLGILFFGTCMTAFVKAYAEHAGVLDKERAKGMPGLLERSERVVLLMMAFIAIVASLPYAIYVIAATAVLSLITFIQRVYFVLAG